MMNILEIQDALKGLSNDQLVRELRTPSGSAPAFLVATEIDRRQKMRQRFTKQQPQTTVIDDLTMQMNQGIGGMMPQPMPMNQPMGMPKSSPELMPARRMAAGGLAGAISAAIAPVLAKAQADAVGGVTNTFVGDTSPVSGGIGAMRPIRRPYKPDTPKTGGSRVPEGITPMPIVPDLGGETLPLPPGYPAPGTNPIMGKGSNPNIAVDRLPLGSIPDARFAREGGQMKPAKGMSLGGRILSGLAGLRNFFGRGANPAVTGGADDILVNPAGSGLRRGGASTIPQGRQLIPYKPPVSASAAPPSATPRMGLFGMEDLSFGQKLLRTGLGLTPFGAGIIASDFLGDLLPSNAPLGDGTLAGAYGLTEDEFNRVLQYMQQEGLNFPTDSVEFADLAARLTGKNVPRLPQLQARPGTGGISSDVVTPRTREEEALEKQAKEQAEEIKKAQAEARNIFEERDKRRMQAGILGAGLETIIRGQKGEPLFQAVAEGLKSQALPALKEQGEMQFAAQVKKNLQDAKLKAEAQGKVGDLVKLRASIAKQLGETVDPNAKASLEQTLASLDQFLFARFGISAGGGMGSQDLTSQALAEISRRSSVVKEATR